MFQKYMSLVMCAGLLALSGCTKNLRYEKRKLVALNNATADQTITRGDVTVRVKSFDNDLNKHYFDTSHLPAQPVQISIENRSSAAWVLAKDGIDLPLVSSNKVSGSLKSGLWKSALMGWLFLPVGIVHGIASHKANKRINKDVHRKALDLSVQVDPGQKRDVLVFVDKHTQTPRFNLRLADAYNEQEVLHYNLKL